MREVCQIFGRRETLHFSADLERCLRPKKPRTAFNIPPRLPSTSKLFCRKTVPLHESMTASLVAMPVLPAEVARMQSESKTALYCTPPATFQGLRTMALKSF